MTLNPTVADCKLIENKLAPIANRSKLRIRLSPPINIHSIYLSASDCTEGSRGPHWGSPNPWRTSLLRRAGFVCQIVTARTVLCGRAYLVAFRLNTGVGVEISLARSSSISGWLITYHIWRLRHQDLCVGAVRM